MRLALLTLLTIAVAACGGEAPDTVNEVPVEVSMVALDVENRPVVILEDRRGDRQLPIWIGASEARSIAIEMEDYEAPRPNTHDLARRVIHGLEGEVTRAVVTELRENTYYAVLFLRVRGGIVEIDSRPSDAIAIALRTDAPIFVRETLFESATQRRENEIEPAGQQI